AGVPANTGAARANHRGACFAGSPAPTRDLQRQSDGSKALIPAVRAWLERVSSHPRHVPMVG
ncbi:hypothetical protein ACW69B_022280, partial [Pseudomonas putida]